MKDAWTMDNPTKIIVMLFLSLYIIIYHHQVLNLYKLAGIPGDDGLHRFIKCTDDTIVDLSVDQFDNYEDVDYSQVKVCYFMTNQYNKGPSKRARILAELMGCELPSNREKVNTKVLVII